MKKYIVTILCVVAFPILFSSCLESYLDKSPESGLQSDDVFKKLDNFKKFFRTVYDGRQLSGTTWYDYNIKLAYPFYFVQWAQKYTWDEMSDCSTGGRLGTSDIIKAGQMGGVVNQFSYDRTLRPILGSMYQAIRICNMTLQNIKSLEADQNIIDDYIGQAHFVRAYAHFELLRMWGGLPYITKVLGPDDQWDIPRLSNHETLLRIAADMDTAATYFSKAGLTRRDNPIPGAPGNLTSPDQALPNGVAAKAFKARALLYAASPLSNELGAKDWEEAAKANWEAIDLATKNGYFLLPAAKYKDNYIGAKYTNEQLWAWDGGTRAYNDAGLCGILNGVFAASTGYNSGENPTQNFVDKFETKYGEPLNTQADRDVAAAAGHYNEQDPYSNRDPRFYVDIIYNQASNIIGWTNAKAQIYYEMKNGVAVYSELIDHSYAGITNTGYYVRKRWGEQSIKNKTVPQYTDPLIRLGELYLSYAEAANEAYGPNGSAPGASMTALQAVNLIRTRIGQIDVPAQFSGSKESLRSRIKNERNIELCFEGHYYFDIRRWKDAPAAYAGPLMGVDIEKVPVNTTYPTGFRYTRVMLPSNRQTSWKDAMYYLPMNQIDINKMKNFVANETW